MNVSKLTFESSANTGFTHEAVIKASHLTATGVQQVFSIDLTAGKAVGRAAYILKEDFDSSTDATIISTTLKVGDNGDDDEFITSTEMNPSGTEVDWKTGELSNLKVYTSANQVDFTVDCTAGKSLADHDTGEVRVLIQIVDLAEFAL